MTKWVDVPSPYEMFSMPDDTDLNGPGVYQWKRATGESYVGKANVLQNRLGDHRRAGMLSVITSGSIYPTDSSEAADVLERALIWLEDPSENVQRPSPSGPLWAATIGLARPGQSWQWYQSCGHVEFNGHVLAEPLDVLRSGCSCEPWMGWFVAARSAVDGLLAQISTLIESATSASTSYVETLEDRLDEREKEMSSLMEVIAELEAANEHVQGQVARLEALRERASWSP